MKTGAQTTRPKQNISGEIVSDIMGVIRGQFYPDADAKKWGQDYHFIRREFVLYLATWLDKRGVTLKPERYKQLLLDRLTEIKHHGATDKIKYFPGYLKHVLQQHLKHHSEDIYTEAKALRTIAENTLLSLVHTASEGRAPRVPELDPVRVLAEARRDLLKQKKQKRPSQPKPDQLSLL